MIYLEGGIFMTNKERLEFIQKHHPQLYGLIEMNVPFAVENVDCITQDDIFECNRYVDLYCKNIDDPQLFQTLLFKNN